MALASWLSAFLDAKEEDMTVIEHE